MRQLNKHSRCCLCTLKFGYVRLLGYFPSHIFKDSVQICYDMAFVNNIFTKRIQVKARLFKTIFKIVIRRGFDFYFLVRVVKIVILISWSNFAVQKSSHIFFIKLSSTLANWTSICVWLIDYFLKYLFLKKLFSKFFFLRN